MKIRSNTLLLIVGILFVLICGLSYFFYTKYKFLLNYINTELNQKIGSYDFNLQQRIGGMFEQYKQFVSKETPQFKSEEEETMLNSFISDLETVDEADLQLEKEIKQGLSTIQEETTEDLIDKIVQETEIKALENPVHLATTEDLYASMLSNVDLDVEEISDEIIDSDVDEDLPTIEDSDDEDLPTIEDSDDEDLPTIEDSDDEDLLEDFNFETFAIEETTLDTPMKEFKMVEVEEVVEEEKPKTPRCEFEFKRGKNKGNTCGRKAHEEGRCKKHVGK